MVHFKYDVLEKSKTISNNGDTTIDLEGVGTWSSLNLFLRAQCINGIGTVPLQRIVDHITELTLVADGDVEIISLTGEELLACAFFDEGKVPDSMSVIYSLKSQWQQIPINFGRFHRDPDLGFKIDKFKNLELTFTMDDFSQELTSTSMTARVTADLMKGALATPRHFLRKIELSKDKPSADGQYVKYTVPSGLTLRKLLFLLDADLNATTGAPTAYPTGDSYNFTMKLGSDQEKLYNEIRPKDLFRLNASRFGRVVNAWKQALSTTVYMDTQLGYVEALSAGAVEEGTGADLAPEAFADANDRYQVAKYVGGADHYAIVGVGTGYMSSFVTPFDERGVEHYLNTDLVDPVKIEWYGHADDHRFRIVKDELMTN